MVMQEQDVAALPSGAKPYVERADEMAAVVCCLLDAWDSRPDQERKRIIKNIYRGLVDMAAS